MCERECLGNRIIECSGKCATSNVLRRSAPYMRRHPVVTKDWDSCARDVTNCENHVLNLLVALRTIEHDVVIEVRRHVLKGGELEAKLLNAKAKLYQIVELPLTTITRNQWSIKEHISRAELLSELEILLACYLKLPEPWSHVLLPCE